MQLVVAHNLQNHGLQKGSAQRDKHTTHIPAVMMASKLLSSLAIRSIASAAQLCTSVSDPCNIETKGSNAPAHFSMYPYQVCVQQNATRMATKVAGNSQLYAHLHAM